MSVKTIVMAAGAAAVLGGVGIGVAQAGSPAPTSTVAPSSTSSTQSAGHESEARGRVAEGETHARHTGTDDATTGPTALPSASPTADDHGSGGHGADG